MVCAQWKGPSCPVGRNRSSCYSEIRWAEWDLARAWDRQQLNLSLLHKTCVQIFSRTGANGSALMWKR